ncbi:hypothetical protein IWX87_002909 [Polaromonas sp. CG_9.7]|uniref:hypothetical protein n=1 Tax=unclassified Polaromonas TaxID=2638319 RepID=UPI0018CAD166|nr:MULTISPECIES: hypothetical protein [unclassified Polaromonas]MBG6073138.1 hypothetical protein [Polaromonas sp. CG_9.7]MDH6184971.1 hypothetical protein [Polaromonas sp. CG_23.6]
MKKRLFLVPPLACAALLLSGCPDAKLPTPTPMVPTPKAQLTPDHGQSAAIAGQQPSASMLIKAGNS